MIYMVYMDATSLKKQLSYIEKPDIFTNHFDKSLQSSEGIFVTYITKHYPVFNINHQISTGDSEIYIGRKLDNERNKESFLDALPKIDWGKIYSTAGTQSCFDIFMGSVLHCWINIFPKSDYKLNTITEKHGCLLPYGIQ